MQKSMLFFMAVVCLLQITHAQNVGIGTTTPNNKLQIGNAPGFSGNHLAIGNGTQGMSFTQYTNTSTWYSNTGFSLMPNGGNGYVGIGTTTPSYYLDVHGTGNAQFNLTEGIGGQTALFSRYTNRLEIQPSDAFQISIGGIDRRNLCVANNGYVGVSTATPTNYLQIGSYTNAGYGGNQLALGSGTNVTVMNQYPSLSNFQSSTALNIQSAQDIYLMPNNGNGHVGINTNTPTYPLEINANNSSWVNDNADAASYGVGFSSGGVPGPSTSGTHSETSVELYVNGTVEAGTYYALSDKRIKDLIGPTNGSNDLETLNKIAITDYTMKDKRTYGNKQFKKVIAQELEKTYPQVVSRQVNFIPNTYLQTDKITKNEIGYLLHFSKAHNINKDAKRLKVYSQKGDATLQILSVLSDFDVVVKGQDIAQTLFVYGEEVNDFCTVDYEGLTTLNISATQELSKIISQQKTVLDDQAKKINTLTTQMQALMAELALLKKKN